MDSPLALTGSGLWHADASRPPFLNPHPSLNFIEFSMNNTRCPVRFLHNNCSVSAHPIKFAPAGHGKSVSMCAVNQALERSIARAFWKAVCSSYRRNVLISEYRYRWPAPSASGSHRAFTLHFVFACPQTKGKPGMHSNYTPMEDASLAIPTNVPPVLGPWQPGDRSDGCSTTGSAVRRATGLRSAIIRNLL